MCESLSTSALLAHAARATHAPCRQGKQVICVAHEHMQVQGHHACSSPHALDTRGRPQRPSRRPTRRSHEQHALRALCAAQRRKHPAQAFCMNLPYFWRRAHAGSHDGDLSRSGQSRGAASVTGRRPRPATSASAIPEDRPRRISLLKHTCSSSGS
jgi:hypothetical protein